MRRILVNSIRGNEILAKSIYSKMDTILMPAGTVIRKDYVERLKELEIESIYIEDEISEGICEKEMTEDQIKEQCQSIVAETLNRYAYSGTTEFEQLNQVVENIMNDILSNPEIMFNISCVRQKDEFIYSHSLNVCALSILIALRMKLSEKVVNDIAVGSLLHDIGYMNVTIPIGNKRKKEEFTQNELKELRMHVIHAYSILEKESFISSKAKEIVLSHHEYLDGSGYPMKLSGRKIGIGTRIVSLCNEFDNMVYGNFTEKVRPHEAIEKISAMEGNKFDAHVIHIFKESVAAYPIGTVVKTNNDQIAIVLRQNSKAPQKPIVRILKDKTGNVINKWIEKDLTKEENLYIKEVIEV